MNAVNKQLDKDRVFHSAQEAFPDFKNAGHFAGFADKLAYVVLPDGRADQAAFFHVFERKTIVESFGSRPSPI